MSILRYFNKHQGWHDGKRTYNGNGGGWNPISAVSDALASIDPGPAIGSGLASVDKAVNDLPGGWALPAVVAATVAAPYLAPELAAATTAGEGALTTSEILGSTGFVPTAGSSFVIDPALAYTTGATAADIGLGTVAPLQGPTYQELGVTGVPQGGMGPTYAELGYTGLNNAEAIAAADAAAKSNLISDALGNIKDASKLSNLLKQGAASGLTSSLGKLAQGANPYGAEQLQVVRGNQSPFSYVPQVAIQDKKPDLSALAELLKQG